MNDLFLKRKLKYYKWSDVYKDTKRHDMETLNLTTCIDHSEYKIIGDATNSVLETSAVRLYESQLDFISDL